MVFLVAGAWGLLVLPPMYFMLDAIGERTPPAVAHPEFYYGFVGVALAWQVAFLVIARDPIRYRPLMPAAMVEKFSFVAAVAVLYRQGRIAAGDMAIGAAADCVLGVLFVLAYATTGRAARGAGR